MTEELSDFGVCDSEAARLLPWFVTGRLGESDAARVARHVEQCPICQADLTDQRRVRAAIKDDGPVEYAPQAGLAATFARIDELERNAAMPTEPAAARFVRTPIRRVGVAHWLTAAVVVQAVGLGYLATAFVNHTPSRNAPVAAYETRTSPMSPASAPLIRAVFSTSMTVGELKRLLTDQRLAIVAGPTDAGTFTLAAVGRPFPRGQVEDALAALRANPLVRFAEPIAHAEAARR